MSVYDITYKTLGHTHHRNGTAAQKGERIPTKKEKEFEKNYLLNLPSIHPEKSLDTHEKCYPKKFEKLEPGPMRYKKFHVN